MEQQSTKNALLLFLDEVGRALEAGDAEHRRGKAKEQGVRDTVGLRQVPVDLEGLGRLQHRDAGGGRQDRQRHHVKDEDTQRDNRGLGDADEVEEGKEP